MARNRRQTISPLSGGPLVRLNLDLLFCITSYLDSTSLARLSQTCHSLHDFVEGHGWKALCLRTNVNTNRKIIIPSHEATSLSSSFKTFLQADKAWTSKTFRSYQSRLPFVMTLNGKVEQHQPQPLLLLTPLALILFTGCEMRVWTRSNLQKMEPLQFKQAQLFYLTNPAGLDKKGSAHSTSTALWDICACTQLDALGEFIVIGRLNGLIEIIRLSKGSNNKESRYRGRMLVNLVWLWRDFTTSTSIQGIHACPSSSLLAIASKNGSISLFNFALRAKSKVVVSLLDQWNIGSRPWSVWVQGSQWIAVGCSNVEPILLFPLNGQSNKHTRRTIRLSTGSQKIRSVYALQTKIIDGQCHLIAGCYDGGLRLYNIDAILSAEKVQKPILPVQVMQDLLDQSAIYCLCLGVGHNGQDVAAGTARHGVCKFYRTTSLPEDTNCSMFAVHPSQSPTYSIVGQFDRLFGVTDAFFWQVDLRSKSTYSAEKQNQQTIAFYKHGEMTLDRTRWPV